MSSLCVSLLRLARGPDAYACADYRINSRRCRRPPRSLGQRSPSAERLVFRIFDARFGMARGPLGLHLPVHAKPDGLPGTILNIPNRRRSRGNRNAHPRSITRDASDRRAHHSSLNRWRTPSSLFASRSLFIKQASGFRRTKESFGIKVLTPLALANRAATVRERSGPCYSGTDRFVTVAARSAST